MSKQVLSIEQMQHLNELGVDTSKASMVLLVKDPWDDVLDWDEEIFGFNEEEKSFEYYDAETGNYDHSYRKCYGVFTLQDVLDLLPKEIIPNTTPYSLFIDYQEMRIAYCFSDREGTTWIEPTFDISNNNLIDAAYEMLCWCAENGYIGVKGERQ